MKVLPKCERLDPLDTRIANFNESLGRLWKAYSYLPTVEMDAFKGAYFSIGLQSDAILTSEDGWQRSMVLTAPMLKEMANCDTEVTLIRSLQVTNMSAGGMRRGGYRKRLTLLPARAASLYFTQRILTRGFLN